MTCRTNWIASCGCCDIVVLCAWGCATWLSYMKIQKEVIELLHEDTNKINQLICHQKSLEPANICKHQPTPQLEICTSNNCSQEWPSRRPAAIKGFNTWRPWELWDASSCHLGRLALFGWKKHDAVRWRVLKHHVQQPCDTNWLDNRRSATPCNITFMTRYKPLSLMLAK